MTNDAAGRYGHDGLYRMAVGVAVATGAVAALCALVLDLSLRDPDGFLGPTYVRLPVIAVLMLGADVVPRAVARAGTSRSWVRETVAVARDRWPWHRLRPALIGLVAFYATYVSYRNLKNFVPLVRPDLVDDRLRLLDSRMTGGRAPADILHDLFGTGAAAHVLSWAYLAFLIFVPVSLGLALVPVGRARDASWYVTALCLNWSLGAASYYALPSLGPVYAQPGLFADLPQTGTSQLQDSLLMSRALVVVDPQATDRIQSIAAFASLHVSVVLTAALIAQFTIRSTAVRAALWVFFGLTATATIYFGWHYLLDDIAGVAIAVASVLLGAWGTGRFRRAKPRPELSPDTATVQTAPAAARLRRRPKASPSRT